MFVRCCAVVVLGGVQVANNHDNRVEYRRLLFTTPNLAQHISGVILFEETLFDKDPATGQLLVKPLVDAGILLGIKVDQGTKHLPGTDNETYTQGLTDLDVRCKKYYAAGCRFAKWRAVLRISESTPSPLSIQETAQTLAKYAAICQANGLVPIVEPEVRRQLSRHAQKGGRLGKFLARSGPMPICSLCAAFCS